MILPLAEPQLAERHAVAPPKAIVLFGPPGTGKTTFAKGIASRLGWPFVELEPARLGGQGPEREAERLVDAFDALLELPSVVAFIDEVEDIASMRQEDRRVSPSLTNELLAADPAHPRLARAPAGVRHELGRATGHRVPAARQVRLRAGGRVHPMPRRAPRSGSAMWTRSPTRTWTSRRSSRPRTSTPRRISSSPPARPRSAPSSASTSSARVRRATTDDFLVAIRQTRPTLAREIVDGFEADKTQFARY